MFYIRLWNSIHYVAYFFSIPVDYRSIVYCNGIKASSSAEWEFVWNTYSGDKYPAERYRLLQGMACSSDEATLEK